MNFLFFDTECSKLNKLNQYLCSFGYVLCDENLNIIRKEDILINPLQYDDIIMQNIIAYSKDELERAPKFSYFYKKIKGLLSDKNNIVIGQTVFMDAKYINSSVKMYKLNPINYPFYDLSEVYRNIYSNKLVKSLEEEAKELNLDVSQGDKHTSLNDAYITYLCLKELTKIHNLTPFELLKKYKGLKGESKDNSVLLIDNLLNLSNNMGNNSQNRRRFNVFVRKIKRRENTSELLKAKKVYIYSDFVKKHYKEMFLIVQLIKNNNGFFTTNKEEANYLVVDDINVDKYKKAFKHKEIISLNNFLNLIKFDDSKVDNYYSFIVHFDILLSKEEKSRKNTIKSDEIKHLKKELKKIKEIEK